MYLQELWVGLIPGAIPGALNGALKKCVKSKCPYKELSIHIKGRGYWVLVREQGRGGVTETTYLVSDLPNMMGPGSTVLGLLQLGIPADIIDTHYEYLSLPTHHILVYAIYNLA